MRKRLLAVGLLPGLLLTGCVTTSTTTRTWGTPYGDPGWARPGHVESVRETIQRQQGNPAAGAVAGAVIGGLIGSMVGGHAWYDRWGYLHRSASGAGAVVGAVGGAAVGAAASQGAAEERIYELFVRFDDGGLERFVFGGYPPYGVGEPVMLTARGLERG